MGVPVEATTNIHDGVCELNADEQEVMSKGSLRPEVAVMRKREVIEPRKNIFWPDGREIRRRGSRKPILCIKKQADGKCHLC